MEARHMKLVKKRTPPNRAGVAAVEFALVVPLLFLFFFAAFEFCRVNMIRHTADNAVYEAARVAIIPGATAEEAEQEAEQILNSLGLTNVDVKVTPSKIEKDTEEVTVRVTVPLDDNSFIPHQFVDGRDIERELTMVREGARRSTGGSSSLATGP
ncbi:MAG: pilus assembly protein [Pirellulaceae bacterium]|nr:pilus assembly protein [Pirellulaceae bacterium]